MFSGFAPGQLFDRWIEVHQLPVTIDWLDPLVEIRGESPLPVWADRTRFIAEFHKRTPEARSAIDGFFAEQERCANALWELFGDTSLLPPFGSNGLLRHLRRSPRYLPLLRWMGRPLSAVLRAHGLEGNAPLRDFLNAVCQITIQCSADEAEAPFAMAAMDYYFRGTGHVRGGIGELAEALTAALRNLGGEVRMTDQVRSLERSGDRWIVHSRKGSQTATTVVANQLPQTLRTLLPASVEAPRLEPLSARVNDGWGAAMLYLVLDRNVAIGDGAHHLELIADRNAPFTEGNHIFCSISAAQENRGPDGARTATVSTHVDPHHPDPASYIAQVHAKMRRTLKLRAPEIASALRWEMTGSPRTFERFTGRHQGLVGGIPRRAGWQNYKHLWPSPVATGVYLVGDSVFPGQSTLATALGGLKLAEHILRQS